MTILLVYGNSKATGTCRRQPPAYASCSCSEQLCHEPQSWCWVCTMALCITYYRAGPVLLNIYERWFRVNVIHDVDASKLQVYIDGILKLEPPGRGGTNHYFKFGVYAQNDSSYNMESRWKNIKVLKKMWFISMICMFSWLRDFLLKIRRKMYDRS